MREGVRDPNTIIGVEKNAKTWNHRGFGSVQKDEIRLLYYLFSHPFSCLVGGCRTSKPTSVLSVPSSLITCFLLYMLAC